MSRSWRSTLTPATTAARRRSAASRRRPADDHAAFTANLAAAGVADRVRHVREFSDQAHAAVTGPIAVLYIDGAHRYAPARADIRNWGARVEVGGTMLIHDSFSSVGVTTGDRARAAVRSSLPLRRSVTLAGRVPRRSRRRSASPGRQRLRGRSAQLPWFAKNLALKVLLTLRLGGLISRITGHRPEWPY